MNAMGTLDWLIGSIILGAVVGLAYGYKRWRDQSHADPSRELFQSLARGAFSGAALAFPYGVLLLVAAYVAMALGGIFP
jgi:hypothetical protein